MSKKRRTRALTEREIDATLERLFQTELTVEEADEALERLQSARHRVCAKVVKMLCDTFGQERATVQEDGPTSFPVQLANTDVAVLLLIALGDATILNPLQGLIRDHSVPDEVKLKLIGLIHHFDPYADTEMLFGQLNDPFTAMQTSEREHLRQLQSPQEQAAWLELMQTEMPPETRIAFVQSVIEIDDVAAAPLLICLCYDPDPEVALVAIDAVERLKDQRALPALEELATYHSARSVRTEARKAADRLQVRASLVPQVEVTPPPPPDACYLTTVDGSGMQVAIMARRLDDGDMQIVETTFDDQEGIWECVGSEGEGTLLSEILGELAHQGMTPVKVSHAQCVVVLQEACQTTWKAGQPLPMTYVAWRGAIEGSVEERDVEVAVPVLSVPSEERDRLLQSCHELLLQDEFETWYLEEGEVGDLDGRYLDLVDEMGTPLDPLVLRDLLRQGVQELVTDSLRRLIRDRLWRTAPLIRVLYVDPEVWQWAVVAAESLADGSPVPAEDHPVLLGFVAQSLENALEEPIDWLRAV
jgi:hypothetical protein